MPEICCILGLCCPPEERRAKIATWLISVGLTNGNSGAAADAMIAHIDADPFVRQLQVMMRKAHGA